MCLVWFSVGSSSASTVGCVTVVAGGGGVFVGFIIRGVALSLIPWRCMSRTATRGEQLGGADSGTDGAMAFAVRTFRDRRGGGTWRFVLVGAFLCAVSKGAGGDR